MTHREVQRLTTLDDLVQQARDGALWQRSLLPDIR